MKDIKTMENKELALIEACQKGDAQAFGHLYDQYFKKIYTFIYYKISHRENTEDLVAETFYKALTNIKKFNTDKGYFSSWLYKIARNTVIDHYRKTKDIYDLDKMGDVGIWPDLYNNLDNKIQLEKIVKKLSELNEIQKEIIILRVWHHLSYKEIAQIVGKSEANCKVIFSRAIKDLRLSLAALIVLFTSLIN